MKRAFRLLGVLAATMGLAFAMAVTGGNTTPMCGTDSPDETACLTAADCTGEGDASCEGAWACIDATCQWQCSVQPAGCYSDMDCGDGQHCSVSDGECNAPPDCPMCDVCWGSCVDDETPPATCLQDSECADGQFCDTSVCLPPPGCTGDMACPAVCYGQCTDKAAGCTSDAECAANQFCDFSNCPLYAADRMPCEPDASGNCAIAPPPCEGTCTTRPVTTGCTSDAECATGEICEVQQRCEAVDCADGSYDCAAPRCESVGVCVPAQTGCWADDECPAGYQCVFTSACAGDSSGAPAEDMPCEPKGVCQPVANPPCETDADCAEGYYCALYKCDPTTNCDAAGNCGDKCLGGGGECVPFVTSPCDAVKCEAGTHCEVVTACYDECIAPDGSNQCDPATGVSPCQDYAQCVPDVTGCTADSECPAGYACQLYPCDCANPDPATGDCACEPWGECVPVVEPGCTTDAECKAGYHCELTSWCECPEGVDCTTEYDAWCVGSGTCVPDEQPLCLTDSDCAAGEVCNALEICILLECDAVECSYCHGYCVPQAIDCFSDADCPAGQACLIPPYMDASGAMTCCPSNTDQMCLMIYPACQGTCVPVATEICGNWIDDDGDGLVDEDCSTTGCTSDAECQWYETCSLPMYAAGGANMPVACCQPGEACIPEMPPCQTEGVCVLAYGYCWSNADCPAGETCEGAIGCPDGAYCLIAAGPGKCAPAAGEICGNGQDDDLDGLVDEGCGASCADGTACAAGEVCEEQTVCPDCYYQDPACLMPCKTEYVCVPATNACVVSGCSGQICAAEPMASDCMWLPYYACFALAACEPQATGACGWTPNDAFKQCMIENGGY